MRAGHLAARVGICLALLMIFSGYASQFFFIAARAGKEYRGSYQLQRFVTEFYNQPVAVNMLGYINSRIPTTFWIYQGSAPKPLAKPARGSKNRIGWTTFWQTTTSVWLSSMRQI